jgi:hypothetical protein
MIPCKWEMSAKTDLWLKSLPHNFLYTSVERKTL